MHNQMGCLFTTAIVNIGAKRFCKENFPGCKVPTQPSNEMNKTQVTKWRVRQTTISLSIAPALFLSPLRAEEKRENHSVPETGKQSAAAIRHHPLVSQPDPRMKKKLQREEMDGGHSVTWVLRLLSAVGVHVVYLLGISGSIHMHWEFCVLKPGKNFAEEQLNLTSAQDMCEVIYHILNLRCDLKDMEDWNIISL